MSPPPPVQTRSPAPAREGEIRDETVPGLPLEGAPAVCEVPRTHCLHCGLSLTSSQRDRGDLYCCAGCERVFALLHDAGLERFYDFRRGPGAPPPELGPDNYAWLDAALSGGDERAPEDPRRLTLDIQGIHCAACVWVLETLFERFPGGLQLRINPSLGKADVAWIPARGDLREWLAEAERFGYRFGPSRKTAPRASRELLVRMGVTFALAAHVMVFSIAYYVGLAPSDGALYPLLGRLSAAFAAAVVVVGGSVFFRSAWRGLRRGLVHLDLPIATGILLAFGGSLYAYLTRGPEAAYFDTVTIFVALMLVGRWLQERVLERNRHALLADAGIENLHTRRYRDDGLESIPVAEIVPGDELWVVPGDLVPVAGIVIETPGDVSLAWITGESEVRTLAAGEPVPAGAVNAGRETMRLAAQEDFAGSELGNLLGAAAPSRDATPGAGGQGWWRRVSAVYVTAVFGLAALGFLLWAGRDLDRALTVTVSVLVVACPCALGLAVPLAEELIHLALRRRGVFLRGSGFLDRALTVRKILFDKTGTLTLGRLTLAPESADTLAALAGDRRAALADLVARSNHPVSRAVAEALAAPATADPGAPERDRLEVTRSQQVRETPGGGMSLVRGGRTYRFGRRSFALDAAPARGTGDRAPEAVFSVDDEEITALRFAERIKSDAREEIEGLAREGYEVHVLSGDTEDRVREVARRLGVPPERTCAGLTPGGKAARVRALDAGDTLMVGDGLNDGPGFDAAHCAATPAVDHPVLPARADFYFLGEGIAAVRRALAAAHRLRSVVRGNLALAVAYNAAALTLCYLGLVTPVVAAILMPLSSVAVVSLTTYRLSGRRLACLS